MRVDPTLVCVGGGGGGLLGATEGSCYIGLVKIINKCGGWGMNC